MTESKREKVHFVFEAIYEKYDFMNSLISFNQHKVWRKKAMKFMAVQKGNTVLDVCTGTGDWALAVSKEVGPDGKVKGLDFSQNMLSVAEHKKQLQKADNVTFIHGDAMSLPFQDDTFDRVSIGFGLRNVPDYLTVLKEINRVLKPGGTLTCLETSQPTLQGYKQLYFFYFQKIMPLLGKWFANKYDEYAWLNESTRNFPGKEALVALFEEAGFRDVTFKSLTGGIAAIHHGRK
ncbi:MAG TPA: demethylmenaquinone methyltransferase [Sporolactobacillaceae bacterium]|nr:demethylmenaquinone methyltransferase [Sporolactobacillaceae bacterium]